MSELPPGIHIAAELSWDDERGSHHTQLRILGDPVRGYLLAGWLEVAPDLDTEFWFASLEEAKVAAQELGVAPHGWVELVPATELTERK
jgi:hypothetical protein